MLTKVLDANEFVVDRHLRPDATYLSVIPTVEANSPEGEDFARSWPPAGDRPVTTVTGEPSEDAGQARRG